MGNLTSGIPKQCAHGWPIAASRDCPLCQPPDIPQDFFPFHLGAKLPPRIKPFREPRTLESARMDFVDFLMSHTLMTREAAVHCMQLIEHIVEEKKR